MATAFWLIINWLFRLYYFAIFARVLLSWVNVSRYHPAIRFLIQITDPLLVPLRHYIPPIGGLDFTPLVAMLILEAARQLLGTLIRLLLF